MDTVLHDYWSSSAAYRVRIALGLLGAPHRVKPVDLAKGEHKLPEHLRVNPDGKVPALQIDGLALTQSLAIIEYLDETRGGGFLPKSPEGRARVRALAHLVAMEIHPVCNRSLVESMSERSRGGIEVRQWMHEIIGRGLRSFEKILDDPRTRVYCHGDAVTLADICLAPQVFNAELWGVDLSGCPRIGRITAELRKIPAVRDAAPDKLRPEE